MKIVTISREYGTNGREIGLEVAEKLGLTLYDRDIIRQAVKESGLEYDEIEYAGEHVSKGQSFIRNITPIQYDQNNTIYEMQRHIILDFASKGPCIILGRCADAILSEQNIECVNVFLHANPIYRGINVGKRLGTEDANVIQHEMKKVDAQRKAHYERYANRRWGDFRNYDLMIDVGKIGREMTIEMICQAAQK